MRVGRRAEGYYVQFCVQAERHVEHQPTDKQLGIDVGVASFTTDSEGGIHPQSSVSTPSRKAVEALASAGVAERERGQEPRESQKAVSQRLSTGEQAA